MRNTGLDEAHVGIKLLGEISVASDMQGFPGGSERLPPMRETRFDPWVRKISWRRKRQSTPVFLPGESHGWRSLVGYSPRGHKESDMTERLHLQYSCLENPGDRGAWWAAIYRVTQSRTRLKPLSSSSKAHAHFIVFTKMHTSRPQLAHHYNHPTTYCILHTVDPHKMLENKYSGIASPIE